MFDFLPAAIRLSIFPSLLSLAPLVPFILRIAIGFLLVKEGNALRQSAYRSIRISGIKMIVIALCLILGFLTQLAALLLAIIVAYLLYKQSRLALLHPLERSYRVLQIAVLISLIFLGPGWWSIDLPL